MQRLLLMTTLAASLSACSKDEPSSTCAPGSLAREGGCAVQCDDDVGCGTGEYCSPDGLCDPGLRPTVIVTGQAASGTIGAATAIILRFSRGMAPSTLVLSGLEGNDAAWSRAADDNDTLTLTPQTSWTGPSYDFTVDATASDGIALITASVQLTVDPNAPSIGSAPLSGATIAADTLIQIAFAEDVEQSSLDLTGSMASEASATWSSAQALTVAPVGSWSAGAATLNIEVADAAGNIGTASLAFSVDATAPGGAISPDGSAVITDNTALVVTFSESMDPTSLDLGGSLGLVANLAWADTTVPYDTLTLTPAAVWPEGGAERMTVDATDVAGNPLVQLSVAFAVDGTPPVASSNVLSGAQVMPHDPIVIAFSESMAPSTLSVGGSLAASVSNTVWSSSGSVNDTLTLYSPTGGWDRSGDLTVVASDRAGIASNTLQIDLDVALLMPDDWLVLPMKAIQVSDDDGSRTASITAAQVKQWVDRANEIYAVARVWFDFDEATDFSSVNSTLINQMTGTGDAQWIAERDAANAVAANFPGHMTVFFRYGPGGSPTGGGFSWTGYNFVAMPSFDYTGVCGHQNITLLAHEVGHYLGLFHSFAGSYLSVTAAQNAFIGGGRDPSLFEGDGLRDNGVDPYISAIQCNTSEGVILDGVPLKIGRHDIMSYYDSTEKTLSPQQIQIVRQAVIARSNGDIRDVLGGTTTPTLVEGETVSASGDGTFAAQLNMYSFHGKWTNDGQLWWGGVAGGSLAITPSVSQAGLYRVYATFTLAPDFGLHQIWVNTQQAGTVDLYSKRVLHQGPTDLGVFYLTAGANSIRFDNIDNNTASTGVGLGLDYLLLQPVP